MFSNYTEVSFLNYPLSMDEIGSIFIRIVNKYRMIDEFPRYFETADVFLHMAEIQTILAIGKNEDVNVTNLAKFEGITKGAVSQMIKKLVKKGLVIKNVSFKTENEVVLRLTEKGKDVFKEQQQYNDFLNERIAAIISKMPKETINGLVDLSFDLETLFKEIIKTRKNFLKNKVKS